jgi:hypothetical protein
MKSLITLFFFFITFSISAQINQKIYDIIKAISAERIKNDVKNLVEFGTRHTLRDTISDTRGIGAVRHWIKSEFENISKNCNNCLKEFYQKNFVKQGTAERIVKDV